jgi:hypothetical protein
MSFTATFGNDLKRIEKDLARCGSQAPRAVSMSLKEAVVHSKSFSSSKIAEVYNLSKSNAAKTMTTRTSGMSGEMKAKAPMSDLYKAGAPQPGDPRFGKGPALSVSVVKGQRTPFKNAFVAAVGQNSKAYHAAGKKNSAITIAEAKKLQRSVLKAGGTHLGVFTRDGKSKLPIKERFTISTPEMLFAKRLNGEVEKDATGYYEKRLQHHIERILGGATI